MRTQRTILHALVAASLIASGIGNVAGQAVTEVFTDYNGFWQSSSATLPDDHHMMIGFTYGGVTYSTGVDDQALTDNGVTFTEGSFEALNILKLSTTPVGQYRIFQGAAVDGDAAGEGTFTAPADSSEVAAYLTDGDQGLDFGTGLANVAGGPTRVDVSNLQSSAINDGKPDLLWTQMAQPNATNDTLVFLDESGQRVGDSLVVDWAGIASVGDWTADFFDLDGSWVSGPDSKPIRVLAVDFHDLALTAGVIGDVTTIEILWGGSSDPAFIALNSESFGVPCDQLTFSGLQLVSAASSPATADATISPTISNGNEPYSLISILTGDTLSSSEWSTILPGRYVMKALDNSDCTSSNSFTISIPNRACN